MEGSARCPGRELEIAELHSREEGGKERDRHKLAVRA